MKTILSIVFLISFWATNAQNENCFEKEKEYKDLLLSKKIEAAFLPWFEVRNKCPKQNESLYYDGETILQYKIDNSKSIEDKEKNVRDLMKLLDQFYKNFPEKSKDYEVKKAMALMNNQIDAKPEIFSLLDNAFTTVPKSFTNANALYTYFDLFYSKNTIPNKKAEPLVLLDKYSKVIAVLNDLLISHPEKAEEYNTAIRAINNLVKDIATCENLADYSQKGLESNKENADWLLNNLKNLSIKCSTQPVFYLMSQKLYELKITAQSSYYLAIASMKQKKNSEAIKYYNESATLQTDPLEKAKIYYTMVNTLYSDDMVKSKEYLLKAITLDPQLGKAYLLLAQLYTYSVENCATSDFEKKAIYYLAIETLNKAAIAEPKLKTAADKMITDFKDKSLTTADISIEKMNGKAFSIKCWINETITFPGN